MIRVQWAEKAWHSDLCLARFFFQVHRCSSHPDHQKSHCVSEGGLDVLSSCFSLCSFIWDQHFASVDSSAREYWQEKHLPALQEFAVDREKLPCFVTQDYIVNPTGIHFNSSSRKQRTGIPKKLHLMLPAWEEMGQEKKISRTCFSPKTLIFININILQRCSGICLN